MSYQLNQYSENFKKIFLAFFLREVIKNSNPQAFKKKHSETNLNQDLLQRLQRIIPQSKKILPEKNSVKNPPNSSKEQRRNPMDEGYQKSIMSQGHDTNLNIAENEKPSLNMPKTNLSPQKNPARILRVPQPKLPPEYSKLKRFQGLNPIFQNQNLDLGKINPLINDSSVKIIESDGPGEPVKIQANTVQYSNIILEKEDIKKILEEFARVSKIPLTEGDYRVVAGRFILWAHYSKENESNFTIRKMPPPRINNMPQNSQNNQRTADSTRPRLNIPRNR